MRNDAIVLKNQFTTKYKSGYGSTVGVFFAKYINRPSATEPLLPDYSNNDLANVLLHYDKRKQVTKSSIRSKYRLDYLKDHLIDVAAGRAFSNEKLSLSSDDVLALSQMLQDLWNDGHTVQKLVVSFRLDYLKELNVVPNDLLITQRGDYRGHVDQLKLRLALQQTLQEFSSDYVNPVFVGAIQVDTLQVHAHVLLVDNCDKSQSKRLVKRDGIWQERGKYTQAELNRFKHILDKNLVFLHEHSLYCEQPLLESENIYNNMKVLTSKYFNSDVQLQRILLSLPKNRSLWYMACPDKSMIKPKELVLDYVDDSIKSYDKALGFNLVYQKLRHVAATKRHPVKYLNDKLKNVKTKLGDSVLSTLKTVVDNVATTTRSNFLKYQARTSEELYKFSDLAKSGWAKFNYRLDKFKQRLKRHLESFDSYTERIAEFDIKSREIETSACAYNLRKHYEVEQDYHADLVDKYHYFLRFNDSYDNLAEYLQRQSDLSNCYQDLRAQLMKQGELTETKFEPHVAQIFLNEPTLQSFRDFKLQSTGQTIGWEVEQKLKDDTFKYSDEFVYNLERLAKLQDAYADYLGYLGAKEVLNISSFDSEMKVKGYVEDVKSFSTECFKLGLSDYTQIVDDFKSFDVDLRLGITKERFNQVKAHDLHELQDDYLSFGVKRFTVSDNNVAKYCDELTLRQQSIQAAAQFLYDLADTDGLQQANNLIVDLNKQSEVANRLISTNELDTKGIYDSEFAYDTLRYETTFSRDVANEVNALQLDNMKDTLLQLE